MEDQVYMQWNMLNKMCVSCKGESEGGLQGTIREDYNDY